jgi:hypothetical protein
MCLLGALSSRWLVVVVRALSTGGGLGQDKHHTHRDTHRDTHRGHMMRQTKEGLTSIANAHCSGQRAAHNYVEWTNSSVRNIKYTRTLCTCGYYALRYMDKMRRHAYVRCYSYTCATIPGRASGAAPGAACDDASCGARGGASGTLCTSTRHTPRTLPSAMHTTSTE